MNDHLKNWRKHMNWKQSQAAKWLGISTDHYCKIERGHRHATDTIMRLVYVTEPGSFISTEMADSIIDYESEYSRRIWEDWGSYYE